MKKYVINKKNVEKWKADVQKPVLFYNDWFLNFAPDTYITARQEAINEGGACFPKNGMLQQSVC